MGSSGSVEGDDEKRRALLDLLTAARTQGDQVSLMEEALSRGADPRGFFADGRTALGLAFERGSWGCVDLLLPLSDLSRGGHASGSILHMACEESGGGARFPLLAAFLDRGGAAGPSAAWAELVEQEDDCQRTPIMRAAAYSNTEAIEGLLSRGAEPRAKGLSLVEGAGCDLLLLCLSDPTSSEQRSKSARLLWPHADPELLASGEHALAACVGPGTEDIFRRLLSMGVAKSRGDGGARLLATAAKDGSLEALGAALAVVDPWSRDANGSTALEHAMRDGGTERRIERAQMLAAAMEERGSDIRLACELSRARGALDASMVEEGRWLDERASALVERAEISLQMAPGQGARARGSRRAL